MYSAKFSIKTITPLFMYGADGETPEIRAASIKGTMRFWWRVARAGNNIKNLLEEENKIFGGSGEGEGKSKIKLSVRYDKLLKSKENLPDHKIETTARGKPIKINILNYLAYGNTEYVRGKGTIISKEYIKPGQEFTLKLESFLENSLNEAVKSLNLLVEHSGIGAKTRNGFGSIKIIDTDSECKIDNIYQKGSRTSYTSYSKDYKYFKSADTSETWHEALAKLGFAYRDARLSLENRHDYNKRQYISSPIQIGKQNKSLLERHGKSVFMNVKEETENSYRGYVTYLPYNFLNNNDKYSENNLKKYNDAYDKLINQLIKDNKFTEITKEESK